MDFAGDRDQRKNKNDDYGFMTRRFIAPDCGQIGQGFRQKLGYHAARLRRTGLTGPILGHIYCPLESGIICNFRVFEFGW